MTATVARPADSPGLQPPEMRFWQRYSPHHEASLSGVGSFAIHFLIAGALILAGYVGWLGLSNRHTSLPVTPVVLADPPGGGGKKAGTTELPVDGGGPKEVADQLKPDVPGPGGGSDVARPDLDQIKIETPKAAPPNAKDGNTRIVKEANDNARALAKLSDEIRRKLTDGLKQVPHGKGGPGSGGGDGAGNGRGDGRDTGPSGTLNPREKRMLRWTMQFDTRSGQDYLAQLRGLGAILAIPKAAGSGNYWVIRDLGAQPPPLLNEDVRSLQRIFWIDDKPDSVTSVMRALGLSITPDRFVAFMPLELEAKMFEMELRFRGRREDDIEETVFQVKVVNGKYTPVVISQKEKR